MNAIEPIRPSDVLTLSEEEIVRERLQSYEQDRAGARPAEEVFRRILQSAK